MPGETEPDDPCSPMQIVNGLQEEGEACDVGSLYNVPQCKDKLVCRHTGSGNEGICATPASEGDGCTIDGECDVDLFCDHTTAQCESSGGVGDPCAYIDATFKVPNPDDNSYNIDPKYGNPGATSIDCKPGATCDPKSKKCVAACSAGTICYVEAIGGPNAECPDKMVCNVTENPDLRNTWNAGVCRPAIAAGKPC